MTAILGYARVSTTGQDLDVQLAALAAQGVESGHVFADKLSGAVNTDRPTDRAWPPCCLKPALGASWGRHGHR